MQMQGARGVCALRALVITEKFTRLSDSLSERKNVYSLQISFANTVSHNNICSNEMAIILLLTGVGSH